MTEPSVPVKEQIAATIEGIDVPKVRLTTSLYGLRKHKACGPRYEHLKAKLGPDWGDRDQINLLTILEFNGVDDCLWALCAAEQDCEQVVRLMVADIAESVLGIFEKHYPSDSRPREAIRISRFFAVGQARAAAWDAARDAARAAASAAAWDAARAAAWAAAWDAARDAASAAAWAAAWDAASAAAWDAAWDAHGEIIRGYLK